MATVITSIGSKSAVGDPVNGQMTMTGSSGSGTPWTGNLSVSSAATANVGDMLFFDNVYYNCGGFGGGCSGPADIIYLITAVSGTTLTIKYISGGANSDPINLKANSMGSSNAQPYVLRYYSTPTTWDAGLDDTGLYSSGDTAKGECYDDSDFSITAGITVDGGGTVGLDTVILSVAVGQRHDGTAKEVGGSGVRFLWAADGNTNYFRINEARESWVEWIDFDVNGHGLHGGSTIAPLELRGGIYQQYSNGATWCIVHDNTGQETVGGNDHTVGIYAVGWGKFIVNCIVYNMSNQGQEDCFGIYTNNQDSVVACNNTVYNIHGFDNSPALSDAIGFTSSARANAAYRNNIVARVYQATSAKCYHTSTGAGGDINNLSTDDTAVGTNCIADVDYTTLFHSTTAGAEDLHILRSSKAVGAGTDLGTYVTFWPGTGNEQNVPEVAGLLNRDINHGDRNSRAMAWDIGASQNSIISTIGTSSRDYSTVAAWLADLDDDTYYGAGSVARGECYADSTFTFSGVTTISGGDTIDLVCKVLTAADDQRHDGTASGTHVKFSSNARFATSGVQTILSWLDISWTGTSTAYEALRYINVVDHCLIHDVTLNYTGVTWRQVGLLCYQVHNNIVYDINRTEDNNYPLYGIFCDGSYKMCNQNTVYNVNSVGDGATTYGIYQNFSWDSAAQLSNNIVMGTTNSGTGSTVLDIKTTAGSSSLFKTNMSSDAGSSVGTDGLTSKTAANQFISTVDDSQDFHLKSGSDAIGTGTDLGVGYKDPYGTNFGNYYGYDFYSTGWQYDINYGNRHAFSQTWDIGASQYAIIATIGTNSRDYSTFTAWEADLDDASYYGKGSVANGQMYKDSDYQWSGTFTQNGGGTLNLFATYLTVAEGQRHDGTANTGVRFLNNGSYQWNCMIVALWHGDNPVVKSFEWVEMDLNGKGGGGCTDVFKNACGGWGQSSMCSFNHCMIHNYYLGNISAGDKKGVIYCYSQYTQVHNNLLFNIKAGNPSGSNPFLGNLFGITSVRTAMMANNTIYGLKHVDSTSGEAMGIQTGGTYDTQEVYNNICVGNETQDFHDWGSGAAVHSHNLSSDSSATGTGAVTDKSAASLFVSTTVGSEDLHLIDGAGALRVGKDLGTKVTIGSVNYGGEGTCLTHVNIDIDGRNRDSQGDDWDIGADQCDSCSEGGATGSPAFLLFLDS